MGKRAQISPCKKALDALHESVNQLVLCQNQLREVKVARADLVVEQIRSVLYELMITSRYLKKELKKEESSDEQDGSALLQARQ